MNLMMPEQAAGSESDVADAVHKTELDKIDEFRRDTGALDAARDDFGRFNMLKFATQQAAVVSIHRKITPRLYNDLAAEAVSEETFSTHANTQTKKRLHLGADVVSLFV